MSLSSHEFWPISQNGARVATSDNLTTKSTTSGIADADNVTFTAVTGDPSETIVIYKDTTNASTSPLIAYIDTATGLPSDSEWWRYYNYLG